ncbi:hypothetical protein GCM10023189_29830 [Nibrella saemangeumensis]|uniref:Tetratricopeptide repeat protein n=1 Tax=Nibrella saemangeumensis TaxID=1084526 RepID=A0ABP8N1Q9_9BACT
MIRNRLLLCRTCCVFITWISWLTVAQAGTGVDTLFRLSTDLRILRLWQHSPFLNVGQYPQGLTAKDSTAVLTQLAQLAQFAQRQEDQRLYWYVQLQKILFRGALGVQSSRLDAVAVAAYMDACPVLAVKASYWYLRGRDEFEHQHFDECFRWLLRAQQAFDQIGYDNIPEISEYLRGLADVYYRFGEYPTCIRYMQASVRYPPIIMRLRMAALNAIGHCYLQLGNYPQAQTYFLQTLKLALTHHDAAYTAIANTSVGHILIERRQFRQALPYLYRGYELSRISVPENAALTALYLAKALIALDSTRKAKAYIEKSQGFFKNKPWSDYDLHYYQAQTLYHKRVGDYRQATMYLDSSLRLQDTLRVRFNVQLLAASQIRVNAERYLRDLHSLEVEKTNAVRIRNIIVVALVLLTLVGAYALRQNHQKRMQEKRVLLARQQQAEALLTQYVANLQEKNQLIETISAELNQASPPPLQDHPPQPPSLDNLLNRVILTEVDWQQFKQLFEDVYPDFFAALQRHFPEVTPAEIRLLALLKLGISTKQMAFMLGVTMNTIRTSRYRLRRKLEHHQGDPNLDNLIQQL